ncbi:hypothetical protein BN1723_013758 [Verticillium longisporum]|uniref:EthD domain-containing protein n=1 Tax=Verticillium longisporum TaxID=100787 RepID=A0A0G4LVC8_VERLO|nr:hypothetical protein BN1723_013758 [Verticillium longisporum]
MALHGVTSCPPKTTTDHPIKCTVEHRRKNGVYEETFMHWFTGQFLPRAVAVLKKHNVLKYAVQKMDSQVGAAFQAEAGQVRPGWKVNDCDLVLEYWVKDLESLKSLASDPEWIQTALEPGNDWFDMSGPTIRIGYDTTYLEHGYIVNVAGRKRRSRVTASFD